MRVPARRRHQEGAVSGDRDATLVPVRSTPLRRGEHAGVLRWAHMRSPSRSVQEANELVRGLNEFVRYRGTFRTATRISKEEEPPPRRDGPSGGSQPIVF